MRNTSWPKRRIECGVVDADQFRSLFKLAHYAPLRAKLLAINGVYCIASSERMTRQKKDVLYMLGYELVHIALQRV